MSNKRKRFNIDEYILEEDEALESGVKNMDVEEHNKEMKTYGITFEEMLKRRDIGYPEESNKEKFINVEKFIEGFKNTYIKYDDNGELDGSVPITSKDVIRDLEEFRNKDRITVANEEDNG